MTPSPANADRISDSSTNHSEQSQRQDSTSRGSENDGNGKIQPEAEHNRDSSSISGTSPNIQSVRPIQGTTSTLLSDPSMSAAHIPNNDPRHGSPLFHSPTPMGSPEPSNVPSSPTWIQRARHTWLMSKGMAMVMAAQFFGSSMNTMTRSLELDGPHGKGMDPFEILFARMVATVICSFAYMWYAGVPHPFGIPSVRALLVIRGVAGFFGVFGLYYSLLYLPLSEATVLTFLAPILCCYACSLVMPGEVFSRKQQVAGVISLLGVILIARPMSMFSSQTGISPEEASSTSTEITGTTDDDSDNAGAEDRLIGILLALVGVLGATVAYTAIRKIGQRTHPLVSVTYFSVLTTIISVVAVLAIPSVSFRLPSNWTEVSLLVGLGASGFLLQFLLTAGLAYEPPPSPTNNTSNINGGNGSSSNDNSRNVGETEKPKASTHGSRATSMVYTQMLFALFYDKVIWDQTPSAMSWAGSGIILGSAIYVALARDEGGSSSKENGHAKSGTGEDGRDDSAAVGNDEELDVDVENGAGGRNRRGRRRFWRWGGRQDSRFDDEVGHEDERRGLLGGENDGDDERDHDDTR